MYAEFQRITNHNLPNTFYAAFDRHLPRLMVIFRQKASKTGKTAEALSEIFKIHDEQVKRLFYNSKVEHLTLIVDRLKHIFWILQLAHFVFAICLIALKMWTGYLWIYVLIGLLDWQVCSVNFTVNSLYAYIFIVIGITWHQHQAYHRYPCPSCVSARGHIWIFPNLHSESP